MRRSSIMAIAVAVGFCLLGSPATAQTTQAATQFNGNWSVAATGTHFRSGTYQLSQVNDVVVGISAPVMGQDSSQINGKVKAAGLVEGSWRGPTGETGWLNLQLAPDGKSFSGQYGFNGRKPEGALVGHLADQSTSK